jgi:hypothetical protein
MPVCDIACNMRLDKTGSFRCHGNLDELLTPTGDVAHICGEFHILKQHIVIWAATPLGEDIDPKVGCILHKYKLGKATNANFNKLELELAANLKYNFPEYNISNVRVIRAYDKLTDIHGIAVSAQFSGEDIAFFTDSEGLLELWRNMRKTLGTLAYITGGS